MCSFFPTCDYDDLNGLVFLGLKRLKPPASFVCLHPPLSFSILLIATISQRNQPESAYLSWLMVILQQFSQIYNDIQTVMQLI
jgi:hypothetical protein